MSRIGKKPIKIPDNVEVSIKDNKVSIKGPKGELEQEIRPEIGVKLEDKKIFIYLKNTASKNKAFQGLFRALLFNMIKGVTDGFEKKLEIIGVGFRASVEGDELVLNIGFSHPVKMKIDKGLSCAVERNIITVSGTDKQVVSQFAADIRKQKKPEPYKGKGIRYSGEVVRRKLGKKAVGSEK